MEGTTITMSMKELNRYEVIQRLIKKDINGSEAAKLLSLSTRQVRRVKAKVKKHGTEGIRHGNKGKKSNNALKSEKVLSIKSLLARFYPDFGPTLVQEKLLECHKIKISKESVRQLMIDCELWKPKPRKHNKEYRAWRPRKEQYGEMIQFDGSYHDWFEGRAPVCCLLAAIDDATGKPTKLQFTDWEGIFPAYCFWREYIEIHGKPVSIYLDRHSTYKQNPKKNVLDNPEALTQFERAMEKLGVKVVHAYSPQAKGRVERLFGTLQDRLVKELRLRSIITMEEANKYVNEEFILSFNGKFAVRAQRSGDLHRQLLADEKERLTHIFAIHHRRSVLNDFTIRLNNQWLQLQEEQPTLVCRKDEVQIEEWMDGGLHLYLRDKELSYIRLQERPQKDQAPLVPALTRTKSPWRPPPNHPWRKPFIQKEQKVEVY